MRRIVGLLIRTPGRFFKLPGDTKRWMNGICYTFPVDARGRFR